MEKAEHRWIVGLAGACLLGLSCNAEAPPSLSDSAASPGGYDGGLRAAEVNGHPIWAEEVRKLAEETGRDPKEAAHALVVQQVLADEARRRGLTGSAEIRDMRWRAMAYRLVEKEVVEPNTAKTVTDGEIQAEYQQDKTYHRPHTRTIAHILSRRILKENDGKPGPVVELTPERKKTLDALSAEVAKQLARAAKQVTTLKDFNSLKKSFENQYAGQGIYLKFEVIPDVSENGSGLIQEFVDEGFRIEGPGKTGGPLWTRFGWHVFFVVDDKPALEMPLEKVRNEVIERIVIRKRTEAMDRLMKRLEAGTSTRIFGQPDMEQDSPHAPK